MQPPDTVTRNTIVVVQDILADEIALVNTGVTDERVDSMVNGELATAAACYAAGTDRLVVEAPGPRRPLWPQGPDWTFPAVNNAWGRRMQLVRAAAMVILEIDRIDRLAAKLAEAKKGGSNANR